jgi:hypothetical protein
MFRAGSSRRIVPISSMARSNDATTLTPVTKARATR